MKPSNEEGAEAGAIEFRYCTLYALYGIYPTRMEIRISRSEESDQQRLRSAVANPTVSRQASKPACAARRQAGRQAGRIASKSNREQAEGSWRLDGGLAPPRSNAEDYERTLDP